MPTIFADLKCVIPRHFAEYGALLDTAVGGGHKVVFAAPPQHGKSTVTQAGICKWAVTNRHKRFAYITYSGDRARFVADATRRPLERAGVRILGRSELWYLPEFDTSVLWMGRGGQITGQAVDGALVIDDILQNAEEARSPTIRESVWQAYVRDLWPRVHPGASIFVMATRWWEDDLSGRLIDQRGKFRYPYLNFEAICDHPESDPLGRVHGEPLFQHLQPLETLLERRRADPSAFSAQFQGAPRAEQEKIFREPARYDSLPSSVYRVGYGLDLAYTAKTSSDWSVLVRGQQYGDTLYVTGCWRVRCEAPEFARLVNQRLRELPGPARWCIAGIERGVVSFLRQLIPSLHGLVTSVDKLVRALPAAKRWNELKIAVPSQRAPQYGSWVEDLVHEVTAFRGVGDVHDDQVDALAALSDLLTEGSAQHEPVLETWQRNYSLKNLALYDDDED